MEIEMQGRAWEWDYVFQGFLLQPFSSITVLEGPSVANVADAKRRVEIVVWSNRLKEAPTHFISIPLNHPTIQERFKDFKDVVLTTCQKVSMLNPIYTCTLIKVVSIQFRAAVWTPLMHFGNRFL